MRKLSVSVRHEVEMRLQRVADSHHVQPETLASELIEQAVLSGDLLDRIAAGHDVKGTDPNLAPASEFDEQRWERTMAAIQELSQDLPKYAPRILKTGDYYPDED